MEIKFEGITVLCGLTEPLEKLYQEAKKQLEAQKPQYSTIYQYIDNINPLDQIKIIKCAIKEVQQLKGNIKILIVTHSPYVLEAVEVYSKYYKVYDVCNYYLATDEEIIDCKDNLEKIYELFADAFTELKLIKFRL